MIEKIVTDGGHALINFAGNWMIQSALLICLGLAAAAAFRRHGAAVQSSIYRATLTAALVAPLATLFLSLAGFGGWSIDLAGRQTTLPGISQTITNSASTIRAESPMSIRNEPAESRHPALSTSPTANIAPLNASNAATATPAPLSPNRDSSPLNIWNLLLVLWLSGSLWLLIRFCTARSKLASLCRTAVAAEPEATQLLQQLAADLGIKTPRLLRSPMVTGACLAGIRRPVILLPEEPMALPLREVLLHELAHARRQDLAWTYASRMAQALFFFQPLLWALTRRIDATAEEVCDDYVVEGGADPRGYASRLVDLAEQSLSMNRAGIGIAPSHSLLGQRVRRILDTSRARSLRTNQTNRVGILLSTTAAILLTGFVGAGTQTNHDLSMNRSSSLTPGEALANEQTLRGVVTDRNGSPLSDVPVYLIAGMKQWEAHPDMDGPFRSEVIGVAKTKSTGEFEVPFQLDPNLNGLQLVAVPDAYAITPGPWLMNLVKATATEHEIRVSEPVRISGQILSPAGVPVAGATVYLTRISDRISANQWQGVGILAYGLHWIQPIFEFWPAPVQTDAEGRFSFEITGTNSLAEFRVEADGFAPAKFEVAPRELAAELNQAREEELNQTEILEPGFSYTLELPIVFQGTITDARTGQPVPDAKLELICANFGPFEWSLNTRSDSGGHYYIEAPSAEGVYDLRAEAEGYIAEGNQFSAESVGNIIAENGVVNLSFALTPATNVIGQVQDEETGRGLPGVAVAYYPDAENPAMENAHNFWDRTVLTDSQGRFTIPTLPGDGYLLAEVNSEEYLRTSFPIAHRDFQPEPNVYPHAFIKIDVPEATIWEAPLLTVHKGGVVEVHVAGPNGEAVQELHIASLERSGNMGDATLISNNNPYRGDTHRLVGLSEIQPHRTFFYSPDLNAGAIVDVVYDPEDPELLDVQLKPAATVRGRLVDEDGKPAADVSIFTGFIITDNDPEQVDLWGPEVAILTNVIHPEVPNLRTDENGAFERTGFFPGAYAFIGLNDAFADGTRHHRIGKLNPGEIRDLGTLTVKR